MNGPHEPHCLFGLLAVGGLRISEALKLEQPDLENVERQQIEQVLRLEEGHVARAAERLGDTAQFSI